MENGNSVKVTIQRIYNNTQKMLVGCNISNGANDDCIIFQTIDAYIQTSIIINSQ